MSLHSAKVFYRNLTRTVVSIGPLPCCVQHAMLNGLGSCWLAFRVELNPFIQQLFVSSKSGNWETGNNNLHNRVEHEIQYAYYVDLSGVHSWASQEIFYFVLIIINGEITGVPPPILACN